MPKTTPTDPHARYALDRQLWDEAFAANPIATQAATRRIVGQRSFVWHELGAAMTIELRKACTLVLQEAASLGGLR